jgi:hypothetical protein
LVSRFEISTDNTFTLSTDATVEEAPSRTSFTPALDLAPGKVFYWRARASDTATGATGPYSDVRTFATIAPDMGRFPNQLVLRTPSNCVPPGLGPETYVFDGDLTVSGDRLHFEQPPSLTYHSLVVDITRRGDQLSGTIGTGQLTGGNLHGTARATNGFEVGLWGDPSTYLAAPFESHLSFPAQQLTAGFSAAIRVWNNFGDGGSGCRSGGFTWLLSSSPGS